MSPVNGEALKPETPMGPGKAGTGYVGLTLEREIIKASADSGLLNSSKIHQELCLL